MKRPSKHTFQILIDRRDYLMHKMEKQKEQQLSAGYEESEVNALNKIIVFASEMLKIIPLSLIEEYEADEKPEYKPRMEDFKRTTKDEKTVLKEICRNENKKLVISREKRNNREYIVFQLIYKRDMVWHPAPKTSLYLSEIEEVIDVLKEVGK